MTLIGDNLPVGIRQASSGDTYEIGVTYEGAFLAFGQFKKGGVDEDVAEAKQAAQDAAAQQPAQQQQPPAPPAPPAPSQV